MNFIIIILGIIVILLAYYIYTVINAVPSLGDNIDLSKAAITIKPSSITNPYSVNYTVAVWIYVTNFPQNNQIDRFVTYGFGEYNSANSLWGLRMDVDAPNLYCGVLTSGTINGTIEEFKFPDSFPIQKWVCVTTVVNNNFIELYINGRYVDGKTIDNPIFSASASSDPTMGPTFGFGAKDSLMDDGTTRTNGSPIFLTHLSRWDYPLSSGEVYNLYNKGNGQQADVFGPAYHLNINLSQGKDNYNLPVF